MVALVAWETLGERETSFEDGSLILLLHYRIQVIYRYYFDVYINFEPVKNHYMPEW